jgi:hypothetical protein
MGGCATTTGQPGVVARGRGSLTGSSIRGEARMEVLLGTVGSEDPSSLAYT